MKTLLRKLLIRTFIGIGFLLLTLLDGYGQTGPTTPQAQQGTVYRIQAVTIKFIGTSNVNEQIVRANMAVRENTDLDRKSVV